MYLKDLEQDVIDLACDAAIFARTKSYTNRMDFFPVFSEILSMRDKNLSNIQKNQKNFNMS